MKHLAPRFAHIKRPLGVTLREFGLLNSALRQNELPVAARPVRATQARVRKADPSTDEDDDEREHGARAREALKHYVQLHECLEFESGEAVARFAHDGGSPVAASVIVPDSSRG